MSETIIIAGAGAAGLMAARDLSLKGYKVIVLEAANRIGGRMHTLLNKGFSKPVEAGAEFVHGKLPITLQLLKQAGIVYKPIGGKTYHIEKGKLERQNNAAIGWDELSKQMEALKDDKTIAEFLAQYFSDDKYEELRESVIRFAEGFDLADINKVSVFALRDEWMNEEGEQYRIEGGYIKLVDHLVNQCASADCVIHTSTQITSITHNNEGVNVTVKNGQTFRGDKIIVTVPLGILQLPQEHPSYLHFNPAIPEYIEAAKQIGFGSVVKILMEFKKTFWSDLAKNIGFAFGEEKVPTWWTQSPNNFPLLTGWLGGGNESRFKNVSKQELFEHSLTSLSNMFNKPIDELKGLLQAWHISNWKDEPHIEGAYSYDMVESKKARQLLIKPINNSVFFAGEGLYEGHAPGTVEAALSTGKDVAKLIISNRVVRL